MTDVTPAMQVTYRNNVETTLQQKKSKLEGAVMAQDDASSEKIKVKDLVSGVIPQEADERNGDTKYGNRTWDGVWLPKTNELYDADLIDTADQLATAIQLGSGTMMSIAQTIERAKDRRILEGFYGPIISGKTGTTSTAFPGGQVIPVTTGGAAGAQKMNVAKLLDADLMLAQAYVDSELERWMVLTAQDNRSLKSEVVVSSSDFKESYKGEVDAKGRIVRLLGWNFIYLELDNPLLKTIPDLATDGSGYRKNPFWVQGGLVANYWQRLRTMLDKMPAKLGSTQYFAGTVLAASRTQAGMSGIILNQKG